MKETPTVTVQFRMDKNLKEQAEQIFKRLGLSMSAAYTIFTSAVVSQRKIPFEIKLTDDETKMKGD